MTTLNLGGLWGSLLQELFGSKTNTISTAYYVFGATVKGPPYLPGILSRARWLAPWRNGSQPGCPSEFLGVL